MDMKFSGVVFLLLLASSMHTEAAVCTAPSTKFRYVCVTDRNCASICEDEGFLTGKCEGVRRQCICTKPCDAGGPPKLSDGE